MRRFNYYPCLESSGFPPACDSCHVFPASPRTLARTARACRPVAFVALPAHTVPPAPAQTVVTLPRKEVIGDSVAAARSVLRLPRIERAQADNFASLVDQLLASRWPGSASPAGKA